MDWITTTARTVDEAQIRALDLLGVDLADAEIQVVEEGKTGLFGRTKTEARVRARIKPKAPPAKEERRPGRGGDRNRGRGGGGNNKGGQNKSRGGNREGGSGGNRDRDGGNRGGNRDDGGRNRNRNQGGNRDGGNNRGGGKETAAAATAASGGGESRGESRGGSRNSGGNTRGRNNDRNDRNSTRGRSNEDRVEMPVDEQRETLESFVTGVAKAFDPKAKVVLVEEGTTLQAQVTGEELGRLVGNKASTLQSLEELSRTAMHRAAAGRRYHRIQVDVDEYRARRREALAKFAQGIARSVVESGESKAMEPMGAADRKLIHDAVAEIDGVETVSEGRDPRRYIVLLATDAASDEEE